MIFIECRGTPREVGRQQGEALRDLIHKRWAREIEPQWTKLRERNPEADARVAAVHRQCIAFLDSTAPDIVEEIRGIGEGAGLTFDRALYLSTYNSLSMALGNPEFQIDGTGCSALAFTTSPVGPFAFKTLDPFGTKEIDTPAKRLEKAKEENESMYVARIEYSTGVRLIGIRLAGSIWTECAVNHYGLAFACASLHPRLFPQSAYALPQHFLGTLAITRCRNTAEVRALYEKTPVFGKGQALAFVDAGGHAVGVEKTSIHTGFNEPEGNVALQTNHVRAANMVKLGREQDPAFWTGKYHDNSNSRVERIRQHLPRWEAATDVQTIFDDLFHAGTRGDLIQDCTEKNHYWITTWAALVFSTTKEIWVAEGLPEEKKFQKWKL